MYKPGDIFFTRVTDKCYEGWVEQALLWNITAYQKGFLEMSPPACDVVHAGVVTDYPNGVHSRLSGGIQRLDLTKTYPEALILRHKDCMNNPLMGQHVAEEAEKLVGQKYDNWANLKFAFPVVHIWLSLLMKRPLNLKKLNCIGFAFQCLRNAGLKAGWYLPVEALTPGMGYLDENLYQVTSQGATCRILSSTGEPGFVGRLRQQLQ